MRNTKLVFAFFCSLILAVFCLFQASSQAKNERAYVGVKRCAMCHRAESRGNQYGQWLKTGHAQAFKVLGTPKAKEIAAKYGVTDPQKSPKCLKCHITGHGEPPVLTKALDPQDGISCESCHGPGADYWPGTVMRDRSLALSKGLVMPTQQLCVKCHNAESPTFKGFNFEERYKKIAHPRPK